MNIQEDYVSFEIAKLLKEKGFDKPCKVWYAEYTSVWGGDSSGDRKYIKIQFDDKNRFDESYKFLCYAPTIQMVMKWLREVHNLYIEISLSCDREDKNAKIFDASIFNVQNQRYKKLGNIQGYEQACEAAIKYCLENLI